jgi:GAF domain-containing protein
LKALVQQATETYDLLKQRTEELQRANAQIALSLVLAQATEAAPSLEASLAPVARAFGESFAADRCIVQLVEGNALVVAQGTYSIGGVVENWLAQDPLTTEAIATQKMRLLVNILENKDLVDIHHYQATGIQAHLSVPIIYRGEVLAVLSLQWKQPCPLLEDDLRMIHLSAQMLAIALTCTRCYRPIL